MAGISPDSSDCLGALSHNSGGCWETSLVEYVQEEIRRGRSNLLKTAAHTHRLPSHVPSSFNLSPNLWSRVICLGKNKSFWLPRGPSRAKDLSWVPQYLTSLFQVMHYELWEFSQQSVQLSIGKARRGTLEQPNHKHPSPRLGKNQT